LLPDVLFYDQHARRLFPVTPDATDDAFDIFMRVLTNGKVTGDNVGLTPI